MNRLIDIYNFNIPFLGYLSRNNIPHDWIMWGKILDTVYEYLKTNLSDEEFAEAEKRLTDFADEICPRFHPFMIEDDRNFVRENAEKNVPIYPLLQATLEYIDKLMWDTIQKTGVPFIEERKTEDGFVLEKFITTDKTAVIPGKYYYINDNALSDCPNVEEIIYEEGVRSVTCPGRRYKTQLKKVVFASTVKSIRLFAFSEFTSLEEVVFCGDDTPFSCQTFENTKWFKEYKKNHKGNPLYIEAGTLFYYTGRRKVLTVPDNVKNIGDFALENKNFEKIILPENLHYIGQGAFDGCDNLQRIAIPDNVDLIYCCFRGCYSLQEIYLPENIRVGIIDETFQCSENLTIYGHRGNESMQYIAKKPFFNVEFVD